MAAKELINSFVAGMHFLQAIRYRSKHTIISEKYKVCGDFNRSLGFLREVHVRSEGVKLPFFISSLSFDIVDRTKLTPFDFTPECISSEPSVFPTEAMYCKEKSS